MSKKLLIFAIAMVASTFYLTGCTSSVSETTVEEITTTTATISTEVEYSTYQLEESTEKEPEPNTSEMVDYIANKAKTDSSTASIDDILDAVEWLKNNIDNIFDSNENMEKTMYYGELLEYKYKGTGDPYEQVGWQAFKTVKYVYRGYETVDDTATIDNYSELKELVNNL